MDRSKSYSLGFWLLHRLHIRLTGLPNMLLSQLPSAAHTSKALVPLGWAQQPKDNISPIKQLSFFIQQSLIPPSKCSGMNDAAFAGTTTIYFTSACARSTWPFLLMTAGGEHPCTPSSAGAALLHISVVQEGLKLLLKTGESELKLAGGTCST